jgi:ubiquinone/menaquinone biosynthesis C-methylase UbiE
MGDGGAAGFQVAEDAAAAYDSVLGRVMDPFVAAVVGGADVRVGDRVLDLACGSGFAARRAAIRAGAGGRVVGVDVNAAMLAVARRAPAASGAAPFGWCRAGAEALPFADDAFDAVVCQQGAQFFPDLTAAVVEVARVLRPGGRCAATVWAEAESSPFFAAMSAAITQVAGAQAGASYAGVFACGTGRLAGLFRSAGLSAVRAERVSVPVRLPGFADFAASFVAALPWAVALEQARPGGAAEAARTVCEALSGYVAGDGSLTVPFVSGLVVGDR